MHMYYTFGNHIYSLSLMNTHVFCLTDILCFLYLCQELWKLYTHVCNFYEVSS